MEAPVLHCLFQASLFVAACISEQGLPLEKTTLSNYPYQCSSPAARLGPGSLGPSRYSRGLGLLMAYTTSLKFHVVLLLRFEFGGWVTTFQI